MTRPFGISILTAAQLVGLRHFLSDTLGIDDAFGAAHALGFGVQMLPLATRSCSDRQFGAMLRAAKMFNVNIMSYEDRWGGSNPLHPITKDLRDGQVKAVIAYYLLFPWRYQGVQRRIELLQQCFPQAVAVDLPGGPVEIDLHKGSFEHWVGWLSTDEARERGVVLDTHHLLGFGPAGSLMAFHQGVRLLQLVHEHNVPVKLIHVQFRDRDTLAAFDSVGERGATGLLYEMRWLPEVTASTPVIIELTPELTTPESLRQIRDTVEEILA